MWLDACINQNMAAIETDSRLDPEFIHRYLVQAYDVIRNYGKGSNQEALNCELVGSLKVAVPTLNEQKEIVLHIKNVEEHIEKLRLSTEREIGLLSELKSSLVGAVVTGKIKL